MGAIILFDGVCNYCNDWVNFVIERDDQKYFTFATLQSESGRELLEKFGVDPEHTDSVVVIKDDKAYIYSSAALNIAKGIGGIHSLAYVFILVPKFIRDGIYKWFAKNRYKWYGKKDQCMIPTPEIRSRFLN